MDNYLKYVTSTTPPDTEKVPNHRQAIYFIDSYKNLLRIDFPVLFAGAVVIKNMLQVKNFSRKTNPILYFES